MKRIDVVSVKGGVGKSFIAFFIAKTLSEDHTVLLFDKDLSSTISRMYNIKNCLLSFLIEESF
ncbi:MAG: P-loop NTPase, partial [Saccharolobus sp.]